METVKLYYENAYITTFDACVVSCEQKGNDFAVVLDKTYFYPEGGGQPADVGTLGTACVKDVRDKAGVVVHITDKKLAVGDVVTGHIDWKNRFDLMQQHSGEHILSGIICAKYHCNNVGFHIGKDTVTIDFDAKIPKEDLHMLEEKANTAIWENIASEAIYPTPQALEKMVYRSKKALTGKVRILRIGEYDCCACCGTHVAKAGEIGMIKILSVQNYKGGTRLEIVCGMRALAEYQNKTENATTISELLSVPVSDIAKATTALQKERDALKQMLTQMKQEKMTYLTNALPKEQKVCYFISGFDAKDIAHFADKIQNHTAQTVAVCSDAGAGFQFVCMSKTEDMRTFATKMRETLGSKGGGKPEAIQGRTEAKKADLQAFWKQQGFAIYEG